MRWKERGMAIMKKKARTIYFKTLLQKNKKLILVEQVLLILLLPFLTTVRLLNHVYTDGVLYSTILLIALLGMGLAVVVPICLMQMFYQKKSANFYYSLPLKRKDIWMVHTLVGLSITLIPILVYGLLTMGIIAGFHVTSQVFITRCMYMIVVIALYMFCMQSILSYVTIRCNNIVDALLLMGAYLLVPLMMIVSLESFLSTHSYEIMLGNGNYIDSNAILNLGSYVSVLGGLVIQLSTLFKKIQIEPNLIYWLLISIALQVFNARYFIKRKAEASEGVTTFPQGYPLVILLSTLCLLLLGFGDPVGTWVVIIFSLILYFGFWFIWKRKITLTVGMVLSYICVLLFCGGLQFTYTHTKGFHMLQEVPSLEQVNKVIVSVDAYNYHDEKTDTVQDYILYDIHSQQQEIMNLSNQLHQDILSKVDKEWDDNAINIQFIYDYKNQPQKIRSYNLSASAYEEFIQPYLKEVEERKNSFTNVIVNK